MKRVKWEERQPGDIFLSELSSLIGTGIRNAELALHPNAPKDFVPTHAGIIGFPTSEFPEGTVIEAWLDLEAGKKIENSVAAINSSSKYAPWVAKGLMEVWRTSLVVSDNAVHAALAEYVKAYGPEKYGWLNLLGFQWVAIVKTLAGIDITNPIHVSNVCSQGTFLFLGRYLAPKVRPYLDWCNDISADPTVLADMDPLGARLLYLAHETKQ